MKRNNYINLLGALALTCSLTGCLKEAETFEKNLRDNTPPKMVEFQRIDNQALGSAEADNMAAVSVPAKPEEADVLVGRVRIASPEIPSGAVTVKLKLNNALLPANYQPLPANAYTFTTALDAVTTTAGTRFADIRIRLKKNLLDLSKNYALAFEFADPGKGYVVNTKGEAMLVGIAVRNKYDGIYRITGAMVDRTNAANRGQYPLTWELHTTGSNSVAVYDSESHDQRHWFLGASGRSYYGQFGLNVTFDNTANTVTQVVNSYGQGTNNRHGALDAAGINTWDPATGNIRISYHMIEGTNIRCEFTETWEFVRLRD